MSESEFMLLDVDHNRRTRNQFLIRVLVIGFAFILGFVIISLIISSNTPLLKRPNFKYSCSLNYDYDYTLLTVRWPPSVCKDIENCTQYVSDKWLIHGLWPTYNNTTWPQFCCFDRKFDVKNLEPIRHQLINVWPNLEPNKDDDSLWKHEWGKHGTCTHTKQLDYFNNTLNLYQNYTIYEWLKDSNIIPSDDITYSIQQFNDVLTKKLGKSVQLWCPSASNTNSNKGPHKIEEIRICISRYTNEVIDCKEESNCQTIKYPKTLPHY